jgi:hypothetical protein
MSGFIAKIKQKTTALYGDFKKHWNVPREGEFVSNKQFLLFCLGGMFIALFNIGGIGFGMGFFAGDIMGIALSDFAIIALVGTITGYAFIFITPLSILIYENFGVLEKRDKRLMHIFVISRFVVGLACYLIPPAPFQNILRGLPYIIGNILVV